MVIVDIVGRLDTLGDRIREIDPLELSADLRSRPHFRVRARSGREMVVSLPRGGTLQEDDVLTLENGVAVVVRAAPEDLLEVRPRTQREWGVAAYQLGNLHRDVRFQAEVMLTPYEPSTAEVLDQSGIPYVRITRAYSGDRYGAYMGRHDHDHPHDHAHPHEHAHPRAPAQQHSHEHHGHGEPERA